MGTYSRYIVIQLDESSDLHDFEFDDYEEALAFVESDNNKAYIVRVEDICDAGIVATKIVAESHT